MERESQNPQTPLEQQRNDLIEQAAALRKQGEYLGAATLYEKAAGISESLGERRRAQIYQALAKRMKLEHEQGKDNDQLGVILPEEPEGHEEKIFSTPAGSLPPVTKKIPRGINKKTLLVFIGVCVLGSMLIGYGAAMWVNNDPPDRSEYSTVCPEMICPYEIAYLKWSHEQSDYTDMTWGGGYCLQLDCLRVLSPVGRAKIR